MTPDDRQPSRPPARQDTAPDTRADQDWADALAGRPPADGADADARREGRLLRQAWRQWPEPTPADGLDPAGLDRLLAEARRLPARPATPACALCQRLRSAWAGLFGNARRAPALWGGLALACVLAVMVLPQWMPPEADGPVLREAGGTLLRRVDRPEAERDALADRLEAEGAAVQRYQRLGRHGLDAEFRQPPAPQALRWLADQGLAPASDGSLRIEFAPTAP